MNFIFSLLLIVFSFTQNSIPNQIEKSIFFFNEDDHKVSLGLSFQNLNNQIEKYFIGNVWLSDNLAINSSLSSSLENSDINLYYKNSITYIPSNFKSNNISANINFGMHRMRFYKSKSYRWYDFSILCNFKFNVHKIILAWNYLTHTRNKHIFNLSYKRKIHNNINIIIGSKLFKDNNIKFQPNLKLMINL